MLEAHELARDQDKKDLMKKEKKIQDEAKAEINKEIKRMKEILGQEYEFKVS